MVKKKGTKKAKTKVTKKYIGKQSGVKVKIIEITPDIGLDEKKKRVPRSYTTDQIREALAAIEKGCSLRKAAKQFDVPRSTLYSKLHNISPLECRKGPPSILSPEEEEEIVKWITYCVERAYPLKVLNVLNFVQQYIINQKKTTPFKDNKPGRHWYQSFLRRNTSLSLETKEILSKMGSVLLTEDQLRGWFYRLKNFLEKKNLLSLNPKNIFTITGTTFKLLPKSNDTSSEEVSVMFTASASGELLPPMILFDLKKPLDQQIIDKVPEGYWTNTVLEGKMTPDGFYGYISQVFFQWLKQNNHTFPIILFVSGDLSYLTLPLCKFCEDNGIEIIPLYPKATSLLQPLDVALFKPLQTTYTSIMNQWQIQCNSVNFFKQHMFADVLKMALESVDLPTLICQGFKATGLYPLEPNEVQYEIIKKENLSENYPLPEVEYSNEAEESNVENIEIEPNITEECILPDIVKFDNSKYDELVNLFETEILDPEVLEAFKKDEFSGVWSGDLTFVGLFQCWLKMKKLQNDIIIYH